MGKKDTITDAVLHCKRVQLSQRSSTRYCVRVIASYLSAFVVQRSDQFELVSSPIFKTGRMGFHTTPVLRVTFYQWSSIQCFSISHNQSLHLVSLCYVCFLRSSRDNLIFRDRK